MWKQKLRIRWIKEEDRNIKFFHCIANHHRKINYVEKIDIHGRLMKSNDKLRKGITEFFNGLYHDEFS